jgi:hypothetical protein
MESFANEHASAYFDYVFELMKNTEMRLIEFERMRTTIGGSCTTNFKK